MTRRRSAPSLASALPGSAIAVATARDVLVLSGSVASAAEGDDAMRLAARYVPGGDVKQVLNRMAVAAPVQVNIKVRVAEVSRDVLKVAGLQLAGAGQLRQRDSGPRDRPADPARCAASRCAAAPSTTCSPRSATAMSISTC